VVFLEPARPVLGLRRPVFGMVHLRPLPGSPRYGGSEEAIVEAALQDAEALVGGGVDGLVVENFGDVPFLKAHNPQEALAAMERVLRELRRRFSCPIGVNVLRNDGPAAMELATACGAEFVRINVYVGARLADQGILEGCAPEVQRLRARLRSPVRVFADVNVKHSVPLGPYGVEEEARDAVERGLADALIVTGTATGQATELAELRRVRAIVPVPVLVGSGLTAENLPHFFPYADGFIVGTCLKVDGRVEAPVEQARVARFMEAVAHLRTLYEA
jgi:membrane complex biogenesis BtpA family protein